MKLLLMKILPYAFSLLFFLAPSAVALESDRNRSARVEADKVEMDFSSGTRLYRGDVRFRQGTIRIFADQIELIYEGEQPEHGIATGNPAVFRQRPDGKDHDVIGTGRRIELDEIKNIVIITGNAKLRQGRDSIDGERIVYDIAHDRMSVEGEARQEHEGEDADTVLPKKDGERPRIQIQPD